MTIRRPFIIASLMVFATGALVVAPAVSQNGASALKGLKSNAPVNVEADRIEVQDRADRAVFVGNVRVQQGNMNLNAARLTVAYTGKVDSGIEISRIDATGGVTMTSPSETAHGQMAIYDLDKRLITLLGNVVLERGASAMRGGRLVINLDSGRAVMDGAAVGGASGGKARVSGTFAVPQRKGN